MEQEIIMKSGAELIAMERERQIMEEKYSEEQDDLLVNGELAGGGACYALWRCGYIADGWRWTMALWPASHELWKPKDPLRDLVRAGALIAAEIDRIQRAQKPKIIT